MKCVPYGDRGLLLVAISDVERTAWLNKLEKELPLGCEEYILGYDSILLLGQGLSLESIGNISESDEMAQSSVTCHKIGVTYMGADLESVAAACNLSSDEVIERHTAPTYTVRMMGFSPGFPYLDGLDPRLHLPRRHCPRNHIAPGTVAIGGAHTVFILSRARVAGTCLGKQIGRLSISKLPNKPSQIPKKFSPSLLGIKFVSKQR
jgi:allophanate hydrolase subunit 1